MPNHPWRILLILALAVCLWSSVAHLVIARGSIGSVDFFHYLCFARDLLEDPSSVGDRAYVYFPGVYLFWRTAMRCCSTSLEAMQAVYLGVLVANAFLVALIVARHANRFAAIFASVWYLVLASRFQGLAGVTEPIATVPFLAGLAAWDGRLLRGWPGIWRTLGLGVGLGLTVLVKQQAGLLCLGAIGLLAGQDFRGRQRDRHDWRQLALLPVVALVVLLSGILAEGRGLRPLWSGLNQVSAYPREGNFLENLYVQIRNDETAAAAAMLVVMTTVAYVWGAIRGREMPPAGAESPCAPGWFAVAAFCAAAGVATLAQLASRPYGHYMLLGIPCLVIAATLQIVAWRDRHLASRQVPSDSRPWVSHRSGAWARMACAMIVVCAGAPLVYAIRQPRTIQVWRIWPAGAEIGPKLWHRQERVARDLEQLAKRLQHGDVMYVLPPRHSEPHFLLGTRSPTELGYSFRPKWNEIDWSRLELTYVLLLRDDLDEPDRLDWGAEEARAAEEKLQAAGFIRTELLDTMRLYRVGAGESGT